MSETNKKEAGVQEETEKDLPETEPVTEPVEESPEATAGTETTEETESAAEDDKESDKETKGRNSFFGKKKKDNKLEQQIEDLTDRLKRNMAEFDNFRKRTEKEKSSMYVIGAKDIIEKILPVVDNFERGLAQAPEDDPFAEGMQKIIQQATKERSEGTAINIAVMKKNKKFQKEQLASEGYTEIEEFFVDKM